MLIKTHFGSALMIALIFAGCLDPDVNTIRPDHQDARVPSNLCENVVCPLSDDPCTQDGVCDPGTGECVISIRRDGDFCDDGNLCTESERCLAGACAGGGPVVCQPISQCHEAGSCEPESGCSTPLKAAGTSCGDGNPCTLGDQCDVEGDCVGTPKVCDASDGCHEAGVCNSATGQCTNPNSSDGKACDGPDTQDLCLTGTCLEAVCVLVEKSCPDAPCKTGLCISDTGECGFDEVLQVALGTPCQDNLLCAVGSETQLNVNTVCDATGACGGGTQVECANVLNHRACDLANQCKTGEVCAYAPIACADGRECQSGEACQSGTCVAGCSEDNLCASGQTCTNGVCIDTCSDENPCANGLLCTERGTCVVECGLNTSCPEGFVCSDAGECLEQGVCSDDCNIENPCPTGEACVDGACNDNCSDLNPCPVGEYCGDNSQCINDCLVRQACDGETGCYEDLKADGTTCIDQNPCTYNTRCQAGACTGDVISCSPADQGTCQTDGQCNVATGECEYDTKPAGASCNTNLCQVNQVCGELGACLAGQERSCRAPGQCQLFNGCDPLVGCEYSPKPETGSCYLSNQGPACDPDSDAPCAQAGAQCVQASELNGQAVYRCRLDCEDSQICALEKNEGGPDTYKCKSACSDGQACTIRDACDVFRVGAGEGQLCEGEAKACNAPPNEQCYVNEPGQCDADSGDCTYEKVSDGDSCTDDNSCTGEINDQGGFNDMDRCNDGICVPGGPKTCEQALCQATSCDGSIVNQASNCISEAAVGTLCREAEFCVQQATCDADGACANVALNNCPLDIGVFPEACFSSLGQCQEAARACYYTTTTTACLDNDAAQICVLQADAQDFGAGIVRPSAVSEQEQGPIALIDLDADGRMDVLIGGLSGLTFYHNQTPEGGLGAVVLIETTDFALEINEMFKDEVRNVKGLLVGDMNNDGAQDLIVLSYPNVTPSNMRFFMGQPRPNDVGGGTSGWTFVEQITYFPENIQTASPSSGVLADFDNDGDLDVFVGSYSGVNNLYLNELDGAAPAFVLGAARLPSLPSHFTTGVTLADFGTDRFPDLAICNQSNDSNIGVVLLEHAGSSNLVDGALFTQSSLPSVGNGQPRTFCKGLSSVDYDADSDQDLFVSRYEKNQLLRFNELSRTYSPVQNGQGLEKSNRPHFQFCDDFAGNGAFKLDKIVSWASAWGDWNADGFLDAYVARGAAVAPSTTTEDNYFMDGLYLVDPSQGAIFEDGVAQGHVQGDSRSSRSAVVVDLNNDGDLDLIVNHQTDRPTVIHNRTEQLNSFRFSIEGRTVNRDAIGSKVIADFESGAGVRSQSILIGGNQTGVSGATQINHIGTGTASTLDLKVFWQLPLGATVMQNIYDVETQSPSDVLVAPTVLVEPGCEIVDLTVEWGPDGFENVPFSAGDADELTADGEPCTDDPECVSGDCDTTLADPVCVALPTCDDEALNGNESAQDCGGADCPACVDGSTCSNASDCVSQICSGNPVETCQEPSCNDTATNGDETDLNCGGSCPNACPTGASCQQPDDCVDGVCSNLRCAQASCGDTVQNGTESDIDCGGPCPGCDTGQACINHSDCEHLNCENDTCAAPTCSDTIENGQERAVDCGGPDCDQTCDDGTSCNVASDCDSGVCGGTPLTCLAPNCDDGVKNGVTETDVDCGGTCPRACNPDQMCLVDDDCISNKCYQDICRAQIYRSVNVRFKVKRFDNHSGQSVAVSIRVNGGGPIPVGLGDATYTDGIALSNQLLKNVIVDQPDATTANIVVQCVLESNAVTVDGTQTQARANLNN